MISFRLLSSLPLKKKKKVQTEYPNWDFCLSSPGVIRGANATRLPHGENATRPDPEGAVSAVGFVCCPPGLPGGTTRLSATQGARHSNAR